MHEDGFELNKKNILKFSLRVVLEMEKKINGVHINGEQHEHEVSLN